MLNNLLRIAKNFDAPKLFCTKDDEHELENACVSYLRSKGYKVVPRPTKFTVRSTEELVDIFYHLLEFRYPDKWVLEANKKKDCAILNNYINDRIKNLGISRNVCLQDCANIIFGLFEYEKELNLNYPLGLWVFGTDKCSWITDKVICYLNNNEYLNNAKKVLKMAEEDENSSTEYTGFDFNKLRSMYG